MSLKDLRVVFMGTPDFAIPSFKALAANCNVVCAVTKADKPKGRGNKIASPPVKEAALAAGIDVIQPETVKTDEFYEQLKSYAADLFVTAAYGKILPERILKLPKYGCINVHASILPYYRGAAPLWRCIMNGETESGVTTMLTDAGMDTGDVLLIEKVAIDENMTMGELHDILSQAGAELLLKTLKKLLEGDLQPVPQRHELATYAPMVKKEDGRINWSDSADKIHNLVRGCNPFPTAYSILNGERIKIWKTSLERAGVSAEGAKPGEILRCGSDGIFVATGGGSIKLLELQGESSKRMLARDYINGRAPKPGAIFES